jgi:hypothetical protein
MRSFAAYGAPASEGRPPGLHRSGKVCRLAPPLDAAGASRMKRYGP